MSTNSDSYNKDLNAKKGACDEVRSSWGKHVGMRDSMRIGDFENSNEESNGNSSDEEDNQLPKCGSKGDAENLNEKERKLMKRNTLEDVSVGQKVRLIKYNEEVRGWTYSSKNPERPPDNKK